MYALPPPQQAQLTTQTPWTVHSWNELEGQIRSKNHILGLSNRSDLMLHLPNGPAVALFRPLPTSSAFMRRDYLVRFGSVMYEDLLARATCKFSTLNVSQTTPHPCPPSQPHSIES